ncbi:MAG: hypothetical protein ACJ8FV_20285 [Xanthobacteraceae bacterium]
MRVLISALALAIGAATALAEPAKTSKERLSDKASDEQRVDDCRVPPERRSTATRPDCPERTAPAATRGRPAPR